MLHTVSLLYARHLSVLNSPCRTNENACEVQICELGYRHMKGRAAVIQLIHCILIKQTVMRGVNMAVGLEKQKMLIN